MKEVIIIRKGNVKGKTRLPLPKPGGPMSTKKGKKGYDRRRMKRLTEEEVREALDEVQDLGIIVRL